MRLAAVLGLRNIGSLSAAPSIRGNFFPGLSGDPERDRRFGNLAICVMAGHGMS